MVSKRVLGTGARRFLIVEKEVASLVLLQVTTRARGFKCEINIRLGEENKGREGEGETARWTAIGFVGTVIMILLSESRRSSSLCLSPFLNGLKVTIFLVLSSYDL